jgi:hypothetical protein
MKSLSEQLQEILKQANRLAASQERERCADLVQQLSDGTEDQVIRDILGEVVTAIRRLPDAD